jgi:two-component system LytT family response regulator
MPKITGFEMLELLEQAPPVIFTTAFDEYAIKAFESHAVDYLLKPFNQDRFDKAVAKWKEQRSTATGKATQDLIESASLSPSQSQRIVVKKREQNKDHPGSGYILPGSGLMIM